MRSYSKKMMTSTPVAMSYNTFEGTVAGAAHVGASVGSSGSIVVGVTVSLVGTVT